MSETRLRPRTVSEIVDTAFQLYRQDPAQYIAVTAVAYAPWLLIQMFVLPKPAVLTTGADEMSLAVLNLVTAFGTWVSLVLMSGVIVRLGSESYLGKPGPRDVGRTIREVLPRVPALMLGGFYKFLLSMLGILCFIVGLFYVAARYFAVGTAIVLEDRTAAGALGRSSALSKGNKRHILNTLGLVALIYFVASLAAGVLAGLTRSNVIVGVVSTGFTVVAYPVIGLAEMVLYYDARIRNEGFDIEMMAQGLETDPTGV